MWTSFAATGNPNCWCTVGNDWTPALAPGGDGIIDVPLVCLNLKDTCSVIELPEMKRAEFWDRMVPYEDN